MFLLQTDINSIHSQPNMRYAETAGRVFAKKSDYVNAIVRACACKLHKSYYCFTTLFHFSHSLSHPDLRFGVTVPVLVFSNGVIKQEIKR